MFRERAKKGGEKKKRSFSYLIHKCLGKEAKKRREGEKRSYIYNILDEALFFLEEL
jgi:hypothetical protein